AQRDYDRVLRAAPAHGEALTGLGVVLSRRGLWSAAVTLLRRAAEADAGRAAAWYYLGEALNHVDDLRGALAAYERAVELEPRNVKALYGLGIVLDRLNRPDEATRMYRRSREAAGRRSAWAWTSSRSSLPTRSSAPLPPASARHRPGPAGSR